MTEEMRRELTDAGFDVDDALKRLLNNERLYEKFLKRFIADQNFTKLEEAVHSCKKQEAFDAAHTLKGLCGNLSINSLLDPVCRQVELFRAGDWDEGAALMDEVSREYNKVVGLLSRL